MTVEEAGELLRRMYETAPYREKTTYIRLFGIKYASDLDSLSLKDVVTKAGLGRPSYDTEVRKGMNLAKYVQMKAGVGLE